jgi:nicotinamidase-related amidase
MKLLIVVDMQNDFLHPDGKNYGGKACRDIIPFICDRIMFYRENNDVVILSMDTHEKDDKQFVIWPQHCIYKSKGWELVDEIKKISAGCTIIKKSKFSIFYKTGLDTFIDVENSEVEVTGVFTSMCVSHTIADLYNRDAIITVLKKGVADADPESNLQSLKYFEKIYRAKVI